jgi:hypothetical protein
MITIFSSSQQSKQYPYSIAVSLLLHGGVIGLLFVGIANRSKVIDPPLAQNYTVRHLQLRVPDPQSYDSSESADSDTKHKGRAAQRDAPSPDARQLLAHQQPTPQINSTPAPQTLVQPRISPKLFLTEELPAPSAIMWTDESAYKLIVPSSLLQKAAVNVKPSLEEPNQEENLADIRVTSFQRGSDTIPILPSSTSPVVVRGPEQVSKIPETASNTADKPQLARLLSLTDLRMKEGSVPLPPVNQTAAALPGVLALARSAGAAPHGVTDSDSGGLPSTTRITPRKDGKFGMVVVGASLEELYPQTAGIWNGRMVYTVYLHTGQSKNWILQYSQPRSAEDPVIGNTSHIEAPWPTDMVVPNLNGRVNTDALLVHGILNREGQFEKLAVVFPQQFPLVQFLLDALQQWRFRPATLNGQATMLDFLLIIPVEQD